MPRSKTRSRFRLYVLGRINDRASSQQLTTFAEFETGRALTRPQLSKAAIASITTKISNLRGFLESNFPPDYTEASVQELGTELFDLLIQGEVKELFAFARGKSTGLTPFEIFVE